MISMQVTNSQEVMNLIGQLPKKLQPKVMKQVVRFSTRLAVSAIKRNAPVSKKAHKARGHLIQSGNLRSSIALMDMKRARYVTMIIGAKVDGYKGGWYAHFVDQDRHVVSSGHKVIYRRHGGKRTYSSEGGVRRGDQFFRRGWLSSEATVKKRLWDESKRIVERALSRVK